MKHRSLFRPEVISLELRYLKIFMRSEVFVLHLIEIALGMVVLALALLLIPLLQWLFGR